MEADEARALLKRTLAKRDRRERAAAEGRAETYAVIRQVSPYLPQVEIARMSGWTTQYIRDIRDGKQG